MVKARRPPMPESRSRRYYDLVGLAFFFVGAACLLWLTLPQNGAIPQAMDDVLRLLAGSGAYVIPVILMFVGTMFLVGYERMSFSHSTIGSFLLFLAFVTWRHLHLIAAQAAAAAPGADFVKLASDENLVKEAGGYIG